MEQRPHPATGRTRPQTWDLAENAVSPREAKAYSHWLSLLNDHGVLYAVGGAYAIHAYTGLLRNTKDLDIYIKPADLKSALTVFDAAGYPTEVRDCGWLAKVFCRNLDCYMDLLFAATHQRFPIRDDWFENRQPARICGVETSILAMEQLFVSKALLARRYRFDGADLVHLILSAKGRINWKRILNYLEDQWELLLWYLLLFHFVYPGHADYLPQQLMAELFERVRNQWQHPPGQKKFRGTLLDPGTFEEDWRRCGYTDPARNEPLVDKDGQEY